MRAVDSAPVRYLASAAALVLAFILVWQSGEVFARAQEVSASTFEFQPGKFAAAYLLIAVSGGVIGALILFNVGRPQGWRGPLLVASALCAAMVGALLLWLNGTDIGLSPANAGWLFSSGTQTVASFAAGLMAVIGLGIKSAVPAE